MVIENWVTEIDYIIRMWRADMWRLRGEAKKASTKVENITYDSIAEKLNEITLELIKLRDRHNQ